MQKTIPTLFLVAATCFLVFSAASAQTTVGLGKRCNDANTTIACKAPYQCGSAGVCEQPNQKDPELSACKQKLIENGLDSNQRVALVNQYCLHASSCPNLLDRIDKLGNVPLISPHGVFLGSSVERNEALEKACRECKQDNQRRCFFREGGLKFE